MCTYGLRENGLHFIDGLKSQVEHFVDRIVATSGTGQLMRHQIGIRLALPREFSGRSQQAIVNDVIATHWLFRFHVSMSAALQRSAPSCTTGFTTTGSFAADTWIKSSRTAILSHGWKSPS